MIRDLVTEAGRQCNDHFIAVKYVIFHCRVFIYVKQNSVALAEINLSQMSMHDFQNNVILKKSTEMFTEYSGKNFAETDVM